MILFPCAFFQKCGTTCPILTYFRHIIFCAYIKFLFKEIYLNF
jgi:hypothetical protein